MTPTKSARHNTCSAAKVAAPERRSVSCARNRDAPAKSNRDLVDLWDRCAEGGEHAPWSRFFEAVHESLRAYGHHLIKAGLSSHDPAQVEDWVQEVYLRLLAKDRAVLRRTRFANDKTLRAFLRKILKRVAIDTHRRQGVRKEMSCGDRLDALAESQAVTVCERRHPERTYLAKEQLCRFAGQCDALAAESRHPIRNRRIWRMAWLEGCSAEEIAAVAGLSQGGVHATVSRLRTSLARLHRCRVAPGRRDVSDSSLES